MIRRLEEDDVDKVMKIWLEGNVKAHGFIKRTYWESHWDEVKKMLPQASVYVYENGDQIQGFVGLMNDEIAGIFVLSDAQSKGIGKQLLDHVKQSHDKLSLQVYEKNERAMKFYQRENFVIQTQEVDCNTEEKEYLMIWKR